MTPQMQAEHNGTEGMVLVDLTPRQQEALLGALWTFMLTDERLGESSLSVLFDQPRVDARGEVTERSVAMRRWIDAFQRVNRIVEQGLALDTSTLDSWLLDILRVEQHALAAQIAGADMEADRRSHRRQLAGLNEVIELVRPHIEAETATPGTMPLSREDAGVVYRVMEGYMLDMGLRDVEERLNIDGTEPDLDGMEQLGGELGLVARVLRVIDKREYPFDQDARGLFDRLVEHAEGEHGDPLDEEDAALWKSRTLQMQGMRRALARRAEREAEAVA
jgi:hypothetical protein